MKPNERERVLLVLGGVAGERTCFSDGEEIELWERDERSRFKVTIHVTEHGVKFVFADGRVINFPDLRPRAGQTTICVNDGQRTNSGDSDGLQRYPAEFVVTDQGLGILIPGRGTWWCPDLRPRRNAAQLTAEDSLPLPVFAGACGDCALSAVCS